MINIVKIDSLEDLYTLFIDQAYDAEIERYRSKYLYRGLSNEEYSLVTSLKRNCKEKQGELEKSILRNFTKYAAIEDPELKESVWRQLIVGQHHGLPTRLLDWTYSPLMALNFATSGEDMSYMDKQNCVVWKIDIEELNSKLPIIYQKKLKEERAYLFTIEMLDQLEKDLEKYDSDMSGKAMVLIEPPSIDQRIINQYSYFSIIPLQMDDIEEYLNSETTHTTKYIIDKTLKWRIRDMLDQMNINERVTYPGLDGLTQWIKRHYYVK